MKEFGCVMLSVPISWETLSSVIDPADVYDPDGRHGVSREPHITVLYGLHKEIADKNIIGALSAFPPVKIVLGGNPCSRTRTSTS